MQDFVTQNLDWRECFFPLLFDSTNVILMWPYFRRDWAKMVNTIYLILVYPRAKYGNPHKGEWRFGCAGLSQTTLRCIMESGDFVGLTLRSTSVLQNWQAGGTALKSCDSLPDDLYLEHNTNPLMASASRHNQPPYLSRQMYTVVQQQGLNIRLHIHLIHTQLVWPTTVSQVIRSIQSECCQY